MTSEEKLEVLREAFDDVDKELVHIQLDNGYDIHEAIHWLWHDTAEREQDLTEIL